MPKRRVKSMDDIRDVNGLVNEQLKNVANQRSDEKISTGTKDDTDKKWYELIQLAEDGELDQSVKYIMKASVKIVNKTYSEYEEIRMQKAIEFLTDLVISKFSSLLGGFDTIQDPKQMEG